jgi:maltose O-acetyltransferase
VFGNRGGIELGNYVVLAPQVYLHSSAHDVNDPTFAMRYGKVRLEDNVFVGLRAVILKGVTVRRGGVVAAGAVLTKDVGEFEIWAGVPAVKIGDRNRDIRELPEWAPLFQ